MDDFLILGDESNAKWCKFIEDFHKSMKWSAVGSGTLPALWSSTVAERKWQLDFKPARILRRSQPSGRRWTRKTGKDLTDNEIRQCRAVLGSAQWRVYQTAPHHAAKLSHLQSLLPKGDRSTLKEVNKLSANFMDNEMSLWKCTICKLTVMQIW